MAHSVCKRSTVLIMSLLHFLLIAQAAGGAEQSLQEKNRDSDCQAFHDSLNRANDRIAFLESEQRKIPRLVKSAIDNILTSVIERKIKKLEREIKSELNTLKSELKADFGVQQTDITGKIEILEKNTEKAMKTLRQSLQDEIAMQLLGRDMEMAVNFSNGEEEVERNDDEVIMSFEVPHESSMSEKGTLLDTDNSPVYGYQKSNSEEESKNNLLLISQMFQYLDEKDKQIASLSKRLKTLETLASKQVMLLPEASNNTAE